MNWLVIRPRPASYPIKGRELTHGRGFLTVTSLCRRQTGTGRLTLWMRRPDIRFNVARSELGLAHEEAAVQLCLCSRYYSQSRGFTQTFHFAGVIIRAVGNIACDRIVAWRWLANRCCPFRGGRRRPFFLLFNSQKVFQTGLLCFIHVSFSCLLNYASG